jgi:hypothetical protein
MGGVHGNEINGIEIVRRSIEERVYKGLLVGTVIVIPLLNVYGFINLSRDVMDGKDVNRSFPGHLSGSLASRVARIISKKIMPHIDLAIDFHTGGDARYNIPQVRFAKSDKIATELAKCFGVKYAVEQVLIPKSFRKIANEAKIPSIVYEGGESIRLDRLTIEAGLTGIKNVLSSLGMINEEFSAIIGEQLVIKKTTWVRASVPGIFIWIKKSGDFVKKGERLGQIKNPYGTKSSNVLSTYSGYIIGHNNSSVVSMGDALFHIGYEFIDLNNQDKGGF